MARTLFYGSCMLTFVVLIVQIAKTTPTTSTTITTTIRTQATPTPAPPPSLSSLLHRQPSTPVATQEATVRDLIKRLLSQKYVSNFIVKVDPSFVTAGHLDRFRIESQDLISPTSSSSTSADSNDTRTVITITGNTGVAVANGLYYYLKNVANCSTSWFGDQLDTLNTNRGPNSTTTTTTNVPPVMKPIEKVIQDKYRYYQNVCTVSYSMVWWNWTRWQREIDWMALRGINLPLAFAAQESIYRKVFTSVDHYNLTNDEVNEYFTGPAFLAWNRMGNIQSWSGPLSEHWHQTQIELQQKILKRMREFGMYPVVPGFAGHVPRALKRVLPEAKIERLTDWNRFGNQYGHTYFLQPEDPHFAQLNQLFIRTYIVEFGTDHFYNIDLFNEETPPNSTSTYLANIGKTLHSSIVSADPHGVWVMQGWLFFAEPSFWRAPQVKALLTSVPIGSMLVLDLFSEVGPRYSRFDGYYGQPFIWCMLHNFGGTLGMYGATNRINDELFVARHKYRNMLGIGLTPEGIEQNPMIYEYMMDTTWYSSAPNMQQWFGDYSTKRYGVADENLRTTWQLLGTSVYTDPIGLRNHGTYALNQRPQLFFHSPLWYDPHNVSAALRHMAKYMMTTQNVPNGTIHMETFVYDLVDIARQSLVLAFDYVRTNRMEPSYLGKNLPKFDQSVKEMLSIMDLLEHVLQCSEHFLLFNWINAARSMAGDGDEVEQNYNEWQARNQITLWGPNGNIVDYAAKQWSGMVQYYYRPRWTLFLAQLRQALATNHTFNEAKFELDVFNQVEQPFTKVVNQSSLVKVAQSDQLLVLIPEVLKVLDQTIDNYHTTSGDHEWQYYKFQFEQYTKKTNKFGVVSGVGR